MIVIREIDSYKDGGTISVKCIISHIPFNLHFDEVEICLDKRMRGKGTNKLWLGYPDKTQSEMITDENFIKEFNEKLTEYQEHVNHKINQIKRLCQQDTQLE
jgi:hypothetical protein